MIELVNVSNLNTTCSFRYKCSYCGKKGVATISNRVINTDSELDLRELSKEVCPNCYNQLGNDFNEGIVPSMVQPEITDKTQVSE